MIFRKFFEVFLITLTIVVLVHSCSADTYKYDLDIRNKYWKLIELEGDTVITAEGQREPYIIFKLNEAAVRGSGGCNNFSGTYKIMNDSVNIGAIAITRKYCDLIMEQEEKFMKLLEDGSRYRIHDEILELFSNNKLKARLKAIYF
jgi:heat shock protein HslJ